MREGKEGGGKGPLLSKDRSLALATAKDQIAAQPGTQQQNYIAEPMVLDEYNQTGSDKCFPLRTAAGDGIPKTNTGMAVRRLTPRECERLQGFPDDYTLIPWTSSREEDDYCETVNYLMASGYRSKRAMELANTPDGPRYKALGNSMAVCVMEWLGRRIEAVEEALAAAAKPKAKTKAQAKRKKR